MESRLQLAVSHLEINRGVAVMGQAQPYNLAFQNWKLKKETIKKECWRKKSLNYQHGTLLKRKRRYLSVLQTYKQRQQGTAVERIGVVEVASAIRVKQFKVVRQSQNGTPGMLSSCALALCHLDLAHGYSRSHSASREFTSLVLLVAKIQQFPRPLPQWIWWGRVFRHSCRSQISLSVEFPPSSSQIWSNNYSRG